MIEFDASVCQNFDLASRKEWLLTNGIGGFAMGTITGTNTRRYHGHLVSADPAPATRTVLVGNIEAIAEVDGVQTPLSCNQYPSAVHPDGYLHLQRFAAGEHVEWEWAFEGSRLLKRLAMRQGRNTTTVEYTNTGKKGFFLILRPLTQCKFYHSNFSFSEEYPQDTVIEENATILIHDGKKLVITHEGAERSISSGWYYRFEYILERERGLPDRDDMYCPCELRYFLAPGEKATLVLSSQGDTHAFKEWDESKQAETLGQSLVKACEKFLVETPGRTSIIAGYPWFTDWGRDTMIALPGACLCTGRIAMARKIILDYASQMQMGLIPNRFVDSGEEPEYNTVDATLWFAHAIYKTLIAEWDRSFATTCLRSLKEVFDWHQRGTRYGIAVDPTDGLLTQGAGGVQLTWMDAKIGDWVITPRHGKPVEINGLWINALRVMAWIADKLDEPSSEFVIAAKKAEASFEKRFWKHSLGYYMDTVDPDDASLRPNQVIAMALPFSPCEPDHAKPALSVIAQKLLTLQGMRTLDPDDVHYRGVFKGPVSELDQAYHQGTVWPWLMGPYVSALMKYTGDKLEAKRIFKHSRELINEFGIGGIAEVYDGDDPRSPAGCPWQAWSAAEWLRIWVEDLGGDINK